MKNNLLIFIPSIEYGGVEKNLYILTDFLLKKKINVQILSCNFDKKKMFNIKPKFIGINFTYLFSVNKKIKYLFCLIQLFFYLLLQKKKPLILAFQANIYALIIAKILKTKIIIRSNSSPSGWSQNYFKNLFYKFLINLADDVVVNSQDFKKEFLNKFNIKAFCIFNPFSKKVIKKNLRKKINNKFFKKKTINILSVGRLTKQKDHLTLLKSLRQLYYKQNYRTIIIGDGPEKKNLEEFISNNNLKKYVKLIGYKKNPYPYFLKTNIVVLTSLFEGLPNILLEAQFLKKYIISTNCPTGPNEILLKGAAGDLVKIGDYKKIAHLIQNFNKKKLLINKKINFGFKNFSRYNYDLNCKKYLKLLVKHF